MNKMIVAVFDTEKKAYEGVSALNELHYEGEIVIHATAVISKNELGEVTLKEEEDEGPVGTALGMLTGMMIGILGGPAGMVAGAAAGSLGGMYFDLSQSGIDAEFVDDVSEAMSPGKTAVVLDVEEGWTIPIDTRLEGLDAMIFRRNRYEVVDDQLNREADELSAEWQELKEELKDANEDMKAGIHKQMDKVKAKQNAIHDATEKKLDHLNEETNAKTEALEAQIKEAKEKNKKKLEKVKADIKANYEKRKKKLEAASHKVAEYIT